VFTDCEESTTQNNSAIYIGRTIRKVHIQSLTNTRSDLEQINPDILPYIISLMYEFGTRKTVERQLSTWIDAFIISYPFFENDAILDPKKKNYVLVCNTLPLVTNAVRNYPDLFSDEHLVKRFELTIRKWLLQAGTTSSVKNKKQSMFRGTATITAQVTEFDAAPCSGLFTVLNHTPYYSESQTVNMFLFSSMYDWIQNRNAQVEMDPLLEANLTYCLRMINQAESIIHIHDDPSRALFAFSFIEASVIEAIRQVDQICYQHPTLVSKVFPPVKKLFQMFSDMALSKAYRSSYGETLSPYRAKYFNAYKITTAPQQLPQTTNLLQQLEVLSNRKSHIGSVFLALFSFFIRHIHTLVYDPQPLLQVFFTQLFPYYCKSQKDSF
jgi:hypothetical protein